MDSASPAVVRTARRDAAAVSGAATFFTPFISSTPFFKRFTLAEELAGRLATSRLPNAACGRGETPPHGG
jgi:hypothetical protein